MTNDEKDRHVLAAAVHIQAEQIVTFNLKDFPAATTAPYGIATLGPDAFLVALMSEASDIMVRIIHEQVAALQRPPTTTVRLLEALAVHVPSFVALVHSRLDGEP